MLNKNNTENFSKLTQDIPPWMNNDKDLDNLTLVSRIKLLRNLDGYPFPNKATKNQLFDILYKINGVIISSTLKKEFKYIDISKLSIGEIKVLGERGFISEKEYRSPDYPGGLWVSKGQDKSIAVNNEDHIRICCFDPDRDFKKIKKEALRIDNILRKNLNYMISDELGLLTASPVNTGTGCKFSVLVSVPGVSYHEEGYRRITKLLEKKKMTFKPLNEDSDSLFESEFFIIANKTSLKITLDEMIEDINFCLDRIQGYSQITLEFFFSKDIDFIEDKIYEAGARFKYCRNITYDEFVDKFSYILLARKNDYLDFSGIENLKSMLLTLKDNHIEHSPDNIGSKDVDVVRADILREKFKKII